MGTLAAFGLCAGCGGDFGEPINDYERPEAAAFAVASVDYAGGGGEVLDPGDATWIRAGLEGLGLSLRAYNVQAMVSDLMFYLRNRYELVYITGHGTSSGLLMHGLTLTPKGVQIGSQTAPGSDAEPMEINARYVVFSTCRAGRADWASAFGYRTEGIFGYRDTILDVRDNSVARGYVTCLGERLEARGDGPPRPKGTPQWTAMDHHLCWQEANTQQGEPFRSAWISYVRNPSDRLIEIYTADGLLDVVDPPNG